MKLISGILLLLLFSLHVAAESDVAKSPKKPWGHFEVVEVEEPSILSQIIMWIPNRILDLIDVFKFDVGVGSSFGAVVRISEYGQVGYRSMAPASFRVGNFGRKAPYMMERSSEFGVGPFYTESLQREVCKTEVGLGVDPFFAGAYIGICGEELIDFFSGLFLIDLMKDDLQH